MSKLATDQPDMLRFTKLSEQAEKHPIAFRKAAHARARDFTHAMRTLLSEPYRKQTDVDTLRIAHEYSLEFRLYKAAADSHDIVFYDAEAPRRIRRRTHRRERRQVTKYTRDQRRYLETVTARQRELASFHHGLVTQIFALNLETILILDAYRTYRKRLDALKPTSRTPAKTLSLFTATTKPIRDAYAKTLSSTRKLADLQQAQVALDDVLVAVFDMTDTERNTLMSHLKEYRDLDKTAVRITKELA